MPSADAVSQGDKFVVVKVNPKYSIIVPAKNGMPYLKYAVTSALATKSKIIEVIVSLDDTGDGSTEFLSTIDDDRMRLIRAPHGLTMSEHWDFAQSHATGDWQIFLGQDDMLMQNYGEAFDAATDLAETSGTGVVVARRAYITWPPLRERNLKALQYWATNNSMLRDSGNFVREALTSDISYHSGPQMYTTTLVAKSVVNGIRTQNDGRLILGHPQDAFLAASILKQSPTFLWIGSPFSWVGTSIKSAGLAITSDVDTPETKELAEKYASSVEDSQNLTYNAPIDFKHGVNARYFYDALGVVWPEILTLKEISSPAFELKIDAGLLASMGTKAKSKINRSELLTSSKLAQVKTVFGLGIRIQRQVKSFLQRTASVILRPYLKSKYSFQSIRRVEHITELFLKSQGIQARGILRKDNRI